MTHDGNNYSATVVRNFDNGSCDISSHFAHDSEVCAIRRSFKYISEETIRATAFGAKLMYVLSFIMAISAFAVDTWGKINGKLIPLEYWVVGIICAPFGAGFLLQMADKLKIEIKKPV